MSPSHPRASRGLILERHRMLTPRMCPFYSKQSAVDHGARSLRRCRARCIPQYLPLPLWRRASDHLFYTADALDSRDGLSSTQAHYPSALVTRYEAPASLAVTGRPPAARLSCMYSVHARAQTDSWRQCQKFSFQNTDIAGETRLLFKFSRPADPDRIDKKESLHR